MLCSIDLVSIYSVFECTGSLSAGEKLSSVSDLQAVLGNITKPFQLFFTPISYHWISILLFLVYWVGLLLFSMTSGMRPEIDEPLDNVEKILWLANLSYVVSEGKIMYFVVLLLKWISIHLFLKCMNYRWKEYIRYNHFPFYKVHFIVLQYVQFSIWGWEWKGKAMVRPHVWSLLFSSNILYAVPSVMDSGISVLFLMLAAIRFSSASYGAVPFWSESYR